MNQISVTFEFLDPVEICKFEERENKGLLEEFVFQVDQLNDEGWIQMIQQRHCKISLQKESAKQPARKKNMRRPKKQNGN